MNEITEITRMLKDATEALDRLACGESGLLPKGTTRDDIVELFEAVQSLADLANDELDGEFEDAKPTDLEDMVSGWFETVEA